MIPQPNGRSHSAMARSTLTCGPPQLDWRHRDTLRASGLQLSEIFRRDFYIALNGLQRECINLTATLGCAGHRQILSVNFSYDNSLCYFLTLLNGRGIVPL